MIKTRKNLVKKNRTRIKKRIGRTKTRNYRRIITRRKQRGGAKCKDYQINIKDIPGTINLEINFAAISEAFFEFLDVNIQNQETLTIGPPPRARKALADIIARELKVKTKDIFKIYCKLINSRQNLLAALSVSGISPEDANKIYESFLPIIPYILINILLY